MAKLIMNLSSADLNKLADGMLEKLKEVENLLTTRRSELYGNDEGREVEMLIIENSISNVQSALNRLDVIRNSFEWIDNETHEEK